MSKPVAVQLYSLRDALSVDFAGTMQKVAEFGYIGVEPYSGLDPNLVKQHADQLGLQVISTHHPAPLGDDKQAALDFAAALGIKRLIVPWLPPEHFKTVDAIKTVSAMLNEASVVAQANGLQLGYHNHWFEMEPVEGDGRPAYQVLLEHLTPEVFLEIDTYWVKTAGLDPAQVVAEVGSRAPLLHIKDGPAVQGQPMVAVGSGTVDIPAVINAGSPHAEWLVVELDECATDMLTAVYDSYTYLTSKGLVYGR